jgi:hypothetical protein
MGLTAPEELKWAGDEEFEDFEVWAENWPTLEVFLAMSDQWIWTGGMEPRRAGLNLCALPVIYEGLQIPRKKRPEMFSVLREMAGAALKILNS